MTYKELYLKAHPEDRDRIDEVMELYCPTDPSTGKPIMCNYTSTSPNLRCRVCWNQEIHETCSCYDFETDRCNGTKERDECTCGGDKTKCDFYPEKRAKVAEKSDIQKTVEKLQKCGFKEAGEAISKATDVMTEMTSSIKDSGTRREFSTGAVRDIQEGKGRCDLLPLDVVGHLLFDDPFIFQVHEFTKDGDPEHLFSALEVASRGNGYPWDKMADMILDVSMHFEAGAKKYGEYNWRRGIPTKCYIDSAVRHYLKMCRGDKDEPHNRAFVWNILCCIWTCKHKPELNDYPRKEKTDE